MKKNAGFSLVELIIVIAIMAVLIGLLAPQYLRFVKRSRVTTDIDNAQLIVDAINAAVAENTYSVASTITGAGGTEVENVPGLKTLPESKVNKDYIWEITVSSENGVTAVSLDEKTIFPGEATQNEYYTTNYN